MAKKTYPVLVRLIHDGKGYDPVAKPGVTVVMDEAEAAALPEGILGEGVETKKATTEPPPT